MAWWSSISRTLVSGVNQTNAPVDFSLDVQCRQKNLQIVVDSTYYSVSNTWYIFAIIARIYLSLTESFGGSTHCSRILRYYSILVMEWWCRMVCKCVSFQRLYMKTSIKDGIFQLLFSSYLGDHKLEPSQHSVAGFRLPTCYFNR